MDYLVCFEIIKTNGEVGSELGKGYGLVTHEYVTFMLFGCREWDLKQASRDVSPRWGSTCQQSVGRAFLPDGLLSHNNV